MQTIYHPDGTVEEVRELCRQRNCGEEATVDVTYYIRGYALDVLLCASHWESFKKEMEDLID